MIDFGWIIVVGISWMVGLVLFGSLMRRSTVIRNSFIDTLGSMTMRMVIFWPIVTLAYLVLLLGELGEVIITYLVNWYIDYTKTIGTRG